MSGIKFVGELPIARRGRGSNADVWREELRQHPGEWAQIKRLKPKQSVGGYAYKPGFEFATRTVDGKRWLFGRYVGNGKP